LQQLLKISRQPSGEPEIFRSIQGEGVTAGTPSAFLRLALCNLACTWCDTTYTWDWRNHDYDREVMEVAVEEVEQRILALRQNHLVVTGGEPLMQQATLAPLVQSLYSRGYCTEVETNGTLVPHPEMVESVSQWNVSPKLQNSGNQEDRQEVPQAMQAFRELERVWFKFVVVGPEDLEEVSALVARYGIMPERVVLMPEGKTVADLTARSSWLADASVERGYRFSTRLHILLWGDERGR